VNSPAIHQPVLLEESLSLLGVGPGSQVVDGTVGCGGHAEGILERTAPDGRLLGLDRDEAALAQARRRLASFGERVELVHGSFRELGRILEERGLARVDAVLLDLGVSSLQLDLPERGFRFASETAGHAPLDMRMDPSAGPTAAELLARASEEQIASWLSDYGELPGARRLAREIVRARREAPLRTAADLVGAVERARVGRGRRHHPATLVFQALRIAVNDELAALADGLEQGVAHLRPGGRLVVIAYHSLEDRLVKRRFRELARGCVCPPRSPICTCGRRPVLRLVTRRAVRPDDEEVRANPRARSARLRAAERLLPEAA
jgi:16S rRNA (cytosine1402-N4)-methyltransferase